MAGPDERRSAARRIYAAAGLWNEHWGRVKTLAVVLLIASAVALIVGGFLVHRYGLVGALAIILGGLLLIASVAAFAVDLHRTRSVATAITKRETEDTVFPKHGLDLKEAWHFHDEVEDHALGNDFLVVEMRYTNKESEKVNLNVEMYYQLVRLGQKLGGESRMYPRTKRALKKQFKFPLEIDPRSTVTGLLVFHVDSISYDFDDNHGITPRWETTTTLVLEEYVSSSQIELAVPFKARAPNSRSDATRIAWDALQTELKTNRATLDKAINSGYWWDTRLTTLPADAPRDHKTTIAADKSEVGRAIRSACQDAYVATHQLNMRCNELAIRGAVLDDDAAALLAEARGKVDSALTHLEAGLA